MDDSTYLEHAILLPSRKGRITNIITIIHVVVDTIQPRHSGTTILSTRTPTRGHPLDRRIADRVARATAALPLEDVEEAEPVAHLVGGSTT